MQYLVHLCTRYDVCRERYIYIALPYIYLDYRYVYEVEPPRIDYCRGAIAASNTSRATTGRAT